MRFNQLGDLVAGVADGRLSVNLVDVGEGGGPKWLNNLEFLANAKVNGNWGLYKFPKPNYLPELVDSRGASVIACGGNNWAVTVQSNPRVTYGIFNGNRLPYFFDTMIAVDGGFDGSLIFQHPTYEAVEVLWADGTSTTYDLGLHYRVETIRMIEGGFIYYEEPNRLWIQLRNQSAQLIPIVDTPFDPFSFVDANGLRWVMYHNDFTYLHPVNSFIGYKFNGSYGPDIDYTRDNVFAIALTLNASEFPNYITIITEQELGRDLSNPLIYIGPTPIAQGLINLKPTPPPVSKQYDVRYDRRKVMSNNISRFISKSMLNDVGNGKFTVTIANPLADNFYWFPPTGTKLDGGPTGNDCVLSVQPSDGALQVRSKGTQGGYEKCTKIPGFLRFDPLENGSKIYLIPYTD